MKYMMDRRAVGKLRMCAVLILISVAGSDVDAADRDVRDVVTTIDACISRHLASEGIEPPPPASPEILLRRTYLSIVGRIPTAREVEDYLADEPANRHRKLVKRLLASEGHVAHLYHFWADLLRLRTRISNNSGQAIHAGRTYEEWIKNSIRENRPYDQLVRELLVAEGTIWDQPAIGYYLRDYGMPIDGVANTAQVFLGQKIVCAQCHDHPFDDVTQRQFYRHAAYASSIRGFNRPRFLSRFYDSDKERGVSSTVDAAARRNAANELLVPLRFSRVNDYRNPLRFPHVYQYDDAKPQSLVPPGSLDGSEINVRDGERRVVPFADWFTSPMNPYFTKVIVNRMWKHTMGRGLFEPVDDLQIDSPAANSGLMECLCQIMIESGYNLRALQNAIYTTEAFRWQCSTEEPAAGQPDRFLGPVLRRMTAAQVWDSLITVLTGESQSRVYERSVADFPHDSTRLPERRRYVGRSQREIETALMSAVKEMIDLAHRNADLETISRDVDRIMIIQERFAKLGRELEAQLKSIRRSAKSDDDDRVADALVRRISRLVYEARAAMEAEVYLPRLRELVAGLDESSAPHPMLLQLRQTLAAVDPDFDEAARIIRGDHPNVLRALAEAMFTDATQQYTNAIDRRATEEKRDWNVNDSAALANYERFETFRKQSPRAYLIDSPAPMGHFLRVFGQSDRELPDNSSDRASITQAMTLLNDDLVAGLSNPFSQIMRDCRDRSFRERIDVVFRTLLSRLPTDAEVVVFDQIADEGRQSSKSTGTLLRAVLNSREFLFIQ
jgi:hypothetical protein